MRPNNNFFDVLFQKLVSINHLMQLKLYFIQLCWYHGPLNYNSFIKRRLDPKYIIQRRLLKKS